MTRLCSLLFFLVLSSLVSAQNVGDLILQQKTTSSGPFTPRYLATSTAPTLYGSQNSLPLALTLGTGFSVQSGQLRFTPAWSALTDVPATFPPSAHGHTINDVSGLQTALDAKLATTTAASTYVALGETYANPTWLTSLAWAKLTGVPSEFTPAAHGHAIADVTGLQTALDAKLATTTAASTYVALGETYANPTWLTSLAWSKLTGVPTEFAPAAHTQAWSTITSTPTTLSGYGISDPVLLSSGTYADPNWLTSLAWSKLTGIPSEFPPEAHGHAIADVTGLQTALDAKLATTTAASTYVALGGTYANPTWLTSLAWSKLTGVPTEFAPSAHSHAIAEVTGLEAALDAKLDVTTAASSYQPLNTHLTDLSDGTLSGSKVGSGIDAANITTGLLDAARLPVPGTTTLGGVMRNTGTMGQFVYGIGSDGALLFATPAGGGGEGEAAWGSIMGVLTDQSDLVAALAAKEGTITGGTTGQYWRGDKSWQTLDKAAVGLGNVENTALSTWSGSSSITTLGTITSGTVPVARVSGLAASATTNTTNAANITSGTLPAARLPWPDVGTLGGVKRNTGTVGQYVTGISGTGDLQYGPRSYFSGGLAGGSAGGSLRLDGAEISPGGYATGGHILGQAGTGSIYFFIREDEEEDSDYITGGKAGSLIFKGGDAWGGFASPFKGGDGGTLDMSGGDASGDESREGYPGGSIITANGGGSINTLTGTIGLGPESTRVTIQAADVSPWTFRLPPDAGGPGYVMMTDGGGNTEWWNLPGELDNKQPLNIHLTDLADGTLSGSKVGSGVDAANLTTGTLPAARLPAPGTSSLGGVMRNTGTTGQFVTGINSSGQLTYDTPTGGGDVTGPSEADDNALVRFDGTSGKLVQSSNVSLDDTGIMAGLEALAVNNALIAGDIFQTTITPALVSMYGTDSAVGIAPSNLEGDYWQLRLPPSAGANGQVLTTDGSGNTSWTTPSGGGGSVAWGAITGGIASQTDLWEILEDRQPLNEYLTAISLGRVDMSDGFGSDGVVDGLGGAIRMHGGEAVFGSGPEGDQQAPGGYGGQINMRGGNATPSDVDAPTPGRDAGYINMDGGSEPGGFLVTMAGGGSIDTTGKGYIQLGTSSQRTTIQGNASSSWTLTLPTSAGSNGQVLTTDGSGTTSWTTISGRFRTLDLPAAAMIPTVTGGATVGSYELATNKVNMDVLEFGPTTTATAQIWTVMPDDWAGGLVKAKFLWTAGSGSGTVVWSISGRAINDDDPLDGTQGTAQTTFDAFLAADDLHVSPATGNLTVGNFPGPGKVVLWEIKRLPENGTDDFSGTARLMHVVIQYFENTSGPASW